MATGRMGTGINVYHDANGVGLPRSQGRSNNMCDMHVGTHTCGLLQGTVPRTAEARPLSLHAARTCPSHSGRLFPVSSCKFGSGWAEHCWLSSEHCYRYGIKGGEGGAQVHGCSGIRHSSGGSMLISLLSSVTRKARPVHRSADPLANKCRSGAPGHPRMRLANTSRCRIRSLAVDVNGGEMGLPKSGSGWPVGKNNAEGGHPCVL